MCIYVDVVMIYELFQNTQLLMAGSSLVGVVRNYCTLTGPARWLYRTWMLCTFAFACTIVTILILRVENETTYSFTTITARELIIRRAIPSKQNQGTTLNRTQDLRTYFKNRSLEAVDVAYKRNIFFTVKTTAANYQERLSTLILTWFQTVHKDDIAIISDNLTAGKSYSNVIREAGFNLITTSCPHTHVRKALCCKSGEEFHSYYKKLDKNSSYQWFCHVDDDMYVNVPQLHRLLQNYDPHQPYYIGRWTHKDPSMNLTKRRYNHFNKNISIKADEFQYATGAAYCISHALMTEARKYFDGKEAFCHNTDQFLYGDDITVGLIVHVLLGHHLTNIEYFSNQYERIRRTTSADHLKKYITVSYKRNKDQHFVHLLPVKNMFPEDQTRFLSFHCLLYPRVTWCREH